MLRYLMFTTPGCPTCLVTRTYLASKTDRIQGVEYDLNTEKGLEEIRKIYPSIRESIPRNDQGQSPVPIIILFNEKDEIKDVMFRAENLVPYLEDDQAYKAQQLAHTHDHDQTEKPAEEQGHTLDHDSSEEKADKGEG